MCPSDPSSLLDHLHTLPPHQRPWFVYPLELDLAHLMGSLPMSIAIAQSGDEEEASHTAQLLMRYVLRHPAAHPMMLVAPRVAYCPHRGLYTIFVDELHEIMFVVTDQRDYNLGLRCVAEPLMMTPLMAPRRNVINKLEELARSNLIA